MASKVNILRFIIKRYKPRPNYKCQQNTSDLARYNSNISSQKIWPDKYKSLTVQLVWEEHGEKKVSDIIRVKTNNYILAEYDTCHEKK